MSAEFVFSSCGKLVLVGWILLLVAPRWRWSSEIIAKFVIPLILALVYVGIFVAHGSEARGNFSSLSGVAELFGNRWLLLAGWVHYLAFDLFVGAWEVRDAARAGIPHWLVVPCLILTFLLGPAGLLAYNICRGTVQLVARQKNLIAAADLGARNRD